MKKNTLYNLMTAAVLLLMSSCGQDKDSVSISGTVNEAKGELLALMHLSGNNPVLVDTIRLTESGDFKFSPKVEKGGPDFFCLVLNGQTIPVISDTLLTPIKVTASKERFATTYSVNDSLNNELRKAVMVGNDLRRDLLNLTQSRRDNKVSAEVYADSVQTLVSDYKQNVIKNYIYVDPSSPVSYYLLFETIQGLKIFDPNDLQDNRAYGAVANLWNNVYPNSKRTDYIVEQTKLAMAARYQARQEQLRADSLIQAAADNAQTFIDLNLPGTSDAQIALSSINGRGNITLLDFTAYYLTDFSVEHNQTLSRMYEKYKGQGLKIYQVCLDYDQNFWKVSAANIPWTVVRDPEILLDENGLVQYSAAAMLYNVQNIPTTFVMGRDGSVIERIIDDNKLDAAIGKAM